jgi:Type IX secretion system membrane protein PorP/SprF
MKNISLLIIALLGFQTAIFAGNPDRQGEAGAYELLLNPWARSSGLHGLAFSTVSGIEAIRLNPAGLSGMTGKMQIALSHTRYLVGTDISLSAAGFATKAGKNGTIGIEMMAVDFGKIAVTTENSPEGTGIHFKPMFLNIGLTYSHSFQNRIYTGLTVRVISEQISNATAAGVSFDAGVQYIAGEKRNLKFGLSLKNVGTKMQFNGDALNFRTGTSPNLPNNHPGLSVDRRAAGFELPSQINIGVSYDFLFGKKTEIEIEKTIEDGEEGENEKEKIVRNMHRLSAMASFTANSFSKDQYGIGLEYALKEQFMLRAAYKMEPGMLSGDGPASNVESGLAVGASIYVPFKKGSDKKFGFDYSFRTTSVWSGTHSLGLKIDL